MFEQQRVQGERYVEEQKEQFRQQTGDQKQQYQQQLEEQKMQHRQQLEELRAQQRERTEEAEVPVSVLISVPKKRFKLAVDRNRMKRQVREAYRRNKQSLSERLNMLGKHIDLAFICITDEQCESQRVTASVRKILRRIEEGLEPS